MNRIMRKPVWDFWPGQTQTVLYNHRRWLEAWNFEFKKQRDRGSRGIHYLWTKNEGAQINSWSAPLLVHLSQRLTGELIYLYSGVRPSSSSFTMLKHLLPNPLANQSQILCGASMGRGEQKFVHGIWVILPRLSPRPYMVKNPQKSSSPEPVDRFPGNLVCSIGDSCPS